MAHPDDPDQGDPAVRQKLQFLRNCLDVSSSDEEHEEHDVNEPGRDTLRNAEPRPDRDAAAGGAC